MNEVLHRSPVTFAETWADPEPGGAIYDAVLGTICEPIHLLAPVQRPAAHAWRYFGEVFNGGHAQYFMNLDMDRSGTDRVPEAIDGLRALGLESVADILAAGYLRWTGAARLVPADLHEASAIFQEREFEDLDDAFYALDRAKQTSRPSDVLDAYLAANSALFVELLPPTEADQRLIEIGDPAQHPDGGRAAWLSLVEHPSPRIRLKAARCLLGTDRDIAMKVVRAIREDKNTKPFTIWVRAGQLLIDAGVPLDEI